jgi:predicted AAA+ superfamily ATPase
MPYYSNLNQRLIKSPKIYFEDTGLASRFQGWTDYRALSASPLSGQLLENLALAEIVRFFQGRGERPEIFFLRTKEKVEIDFLIRLPNQRFVAAEVKASAEDLSAAQVALLDSVGINVIDRWVLSPKGGPSFPRSISVSFGEIWSRLSSALGSPSRNV